MNNQLISFIAIFLTLLAIIGCSNSNTLTPPNLIITVGEDTIEPILGTYSWSVPNNDGPKGIEADSLSPPAIVENHEPLTVNSSADVALEFETPPNQYQIREWDAENNVIGTYKELDLSTHEGIKVFDVLAHWDQGTATYIFFLDIN